MKKIKGFYVHAIVYVLVNLFIIFSASLELGIYNPENYFTALFWGFGLLAHGISVFGSDLVLGRDWEERKVQELMQKK